MAIDKQQVRRALAVLKDDEVTTYKEVAIALGMSGGSIAVGSAASFAVGMESMGARLFNSPEAGASVVTASDTIKVDAGANSSREHWLIQDGFPEFVIQHGTRRGAPVLQIPLSHVVKAAELKNRGV